MNQNCSNFAVRELLYLPSFFIWERHTHGTCLLPAQNRGTFATVKEGTNKETKARVAIKIIDKKDAVFDAESLAQEVCAPM